MSASVSEQNYIKEIQALKEIIQEQELIEQSQHLKKQSEKIQLLEEEINRLKNRPSVSWNTKGKWRPWRALSKRTLKQRNGSLSLQTASPLSNE